MTNEENKADTMQMAEQTLKAGKEFEPRFRPKAEGGGATTTTRA